MSKILLTETPLNSALNHIFRIYSARPCRLRDLERSISPEPAIMRRYSFFESLTYPKPDRWIALIPTHIFQLSMGNAIGNLNSFKQDFVFDTYRLTLVWMKSFRREYT